MCVCAYVHENMCASVWGACVNEKEREDGGGEKAKDLQNSSTVVSISCC